VRFLRDVALAGLVAIGSSGRAVNSHYHQDDDAAETLDYARLAEVVKGLHAAVRDLAGTR